VRACRVPDSLAAMDVVRIAMWSGPRNISTAMMRAWENRGDTRVWDEPLYAYYLKRTGIEHPVREEVIARGETDWTRLERLLVEATPDGAGIYYQKHMTHHLLPEIPQGWLGKLRHCYLIRHPREVIASYIQKRESPTLRDLGYEQQVEIYRLFKAPVFEASDILKRPEPMLREMCRQLDVPFTTRMLSWPPGPRDSDGVWAKHWYQAVERSTGFAPYQPRNDPLPPAYQELYEACLPLYEALHKNRVQI
jgi:Sulfotransferase domain